jgi:hypothetical protein
VLEADCGNTTAGTAGPCLSNIVSVVIFPTAPVIIAPATTCAQLYITNCYPGCRICYSI